MAFALRTWRFVAYAVLLAILTLLGYWIDLEFPLLMLSFGILLTLGGLLTLAVYLSQHPRTH